MAGDVNSFGIMLLEMFARRRPTNSMFNDGLTLHGYFKMAFPEKVLKIFDPSLLLEVRVGNIVTNGDRSMRIDECLVAVVRAGVLCSMESPVELMGMTDVVANLQAARENFLGSRI